MHDFAADLGECFMKQLFTEFLYVLSFSKRTQWAIILGIVFFIAVSLLGKHMISTLHFSGPIAGLEGAIGSKLLKHYDKAALFGLLSFWCLAVKCYLRDRKRFL